MNRFKEIRTKLEQFIKRYYLNELIRGIILFVAIGLLYLIITLLVEYTLWLQPGARTALFWVFVLVEAGLFIRLIAFPLAKLFNLKQGIDEEEASKLIGKHFSNVNDKLLNLLQLSRNSRQSDLLLASIEQKSVELSPIPFKRAIDLKKNTKYLKYAAIPVLIIAVSYISGKFEWFSDSYERVVNYKVAYEPPAPFQFFILNNDLKAIENQDFSLIINTEGEVIPEEVQIRFNDEQYYLKQLNPGEFEYIFRRPNDDVTFSLTSNGITSRPYKLDVVKVPTLLSFDLYLDYPSHTRKKDEVVKSSGNAVVPQGTKVTWNLSARSTTEVNMQTADSNYLFSREQDKFTLSRRLYRNTDYSLNTSNEALTNYESLSFSIDVIRDEYPELNVKMQQDSTDMETLYFYGQVSDDYGLTKLELVYYPSGQEEMAKNEALPLNKENYDEFVTTFPDQLGLEEGVSYDLYFQVYDNDAINSYKRTKSNTFSFRKLTKEESDQIKLDQQNEAIQDLDKALDKFEEQEKELKELSKTQKEKPELNFNDKKKLENFLKRQRQQEEMMQNFNERLKENLEEFENENEEDQFKENLKDRLEENQEQLKKDEELLKELEKLADKIDKEELNQRLEELAKQNKNKKRSLEQLLELTKRYYVSQKMEKLRNELEKLSEKQEKQSEKSPEENTKEAQEELNKEFEDFLKEMEELRKDNQELKKPMEVPDEQQTEEEIKDEQKEATENLEQQQQSEGEQQKQENQNNAKKNQKNAAKKMKQMAKMMEQQMMSGGGEQLSEDSEMLRQILDNLVLFSFDQEDLMNKFKGIQINHNEYPSYLRKQNSLKEHFEHIDDSLFALSLRQPMISEQINKEITEVFFNMDKALGQFSENRLYQGIAAQQYTVTAANTLASFLSDVLDNMEMQMNMSPGQGKGDMQLPDIIMSQQQLNEMMKEGMEKQKGEQEGKQQGEQNQNSEGSPQQQGDGEQQEGEGENNSEEMNGELFEIYKQQQQLRQALQDKLGKEGEQGQGKDLLEKMEEVELDLLNRGFTNRTLQKMMELQHQLLKLENATFQQGQDQKRQSKTNNERFTNTTNNSTPDTRKYFNTTEILNRQALPLRQTYKEKVKEYFKRNNDQF